jgi:large subunit ribosomal protein L24
MPIDASNVLLFCANCKRGVRIGRRYLADGSKERYCRSCDTGLGRLSKAREAYVDQGEQPSA